MSPTPVPPSSDHVDYLLSDDDNDGSSSSSSDEEELELCEAALEEADADGNDSNGDGKYLSVLWLIIYDPSFIIMLSPMVKMTAEILHVKRKTIKVIITLWKNIRARKMVLMLMGANRLTVNPNHS